MTSDARLTGTIVALHADQPKDGEPAKRHIGSYGLLLGDDGQHYVFSAGQFFRNGSYIIMGAQYLFTPIGYRYAVEIDLIDKERHHRGMREAQGL